MSETRTVTEKKRLTRWEEGFYSGYLAALSAALYGEDGTATGYIDAVQAAGAEQLLAWAKKNDDIELPRLKEAVRFIRERKRMQERSPAPTRRPAEGP